MCYGRACCCDDWRCKRLCWLLQNCFGTARAVSILRGSKAKNVESWMMELRDAGGKLLHGAGSSRSDDWWKGLAGVLMGQGHLQSQHKSVSDILPVAVCCHWMYRFQAARLSIV